MSRMLCISPFSLEKNSESLAYVNMVCWPIYFLTPNKNTFPVRCIETVSPEGTFYDTVQVPSRAGDM